MLLFQFLLIVLLLGIACYAVVLLCQNDRYNQFYIIVGVITVAALATAANNFSTSVSTRTVILAGIFVGAFALGVWLLTFRSYRRLVWKVQIDMIKYYLDSTTDISGQGVIISTSAGEIVYVNHLAEQLFKYQMNELIGKSIGKLLVEGEIPARLNVSGEYFYSTNVDGAVSNLRWQGRRKDQNLFLLNLKKVSVKSLFNTFDIFLFTGPSNAAESHKEKNAEAIKCCYYDFTPVIFITLDDQGHIRMMNQHAKKVLHIEELEKIDRNWLELFVPKADKSIWQEVINNCAGSRFEKNFKSRVCDSQGCERLIQWRTGGVDIHGERLIMLAGEDVTEREAEHLELIQSFETLRALKQELEGRVKDRTQELESINVDLELQIDERKQMQEKLLNSERLYRTMAHNFPNGIIAVLSADMRFILIDGTELLSLNLTPEHLTGKSIFDREFGIVDESAREELSKTFKGRTVSFEVTYHENVYNTIAVPLPDHTNRISEILVVIHDITEIKKLEESLYKTIEQEKKFGELKSRFVTMASHEFRTPLSTILSSVFLLESYTGEQYEQKKQIHISRIKRTVNILTETLNDFLRLGKLEEGRVQMVLSETKISDYIGELLKEIQPVMKPGQLISCDHHGATLSVLLDKNILRSILLNLLSNASKYSPEGSPIYLHTELSNEQLRIDIRDTGIGIAPEEQEHIFQRFFRALNAVHIEGTGLGLHIVKKYVELMKGTIDFQSKPGEGTTFSVTIPLHLTYDNSRLILH